jgi:hypothetical protein
MYGLPSIILAELVYTSNHPGNSQIAVIGDVVELTFTADEAIQTPVVTIGGHSITATPQSGVPNDYLASYMMTSGDAFGRINFSLSFSDLAGNSAALIRMLLQVMSLASVTVIL